MASIVHGQLITTIMSRREMSSTLGAMASIGELFGGKLGVVQFSSPIGSQTLKRSLWKGNGTKGCTRGNSSSTRALRMPDQSAVCASKENMFYNG